ncbi:MAG: winged helix-turn-helix domain-containing protein [Pseudomonadota bacterium]
MAIFHFGEFSLHQETRQLRHDEEEIAVEPRVLALLEYLLTHSDRAVSKDELMDAVWPGQIVTEAALTRAIMKTRKAIRLDEDGWEPIKTVQGFGYHFVAPVTASEHVGPDQPAGAVDATGGATPGAGERVGPRRRPGAIVAAVGFVVLAVALGVVWLRETRSTPPEATRVAVLPATIINGAEEDSWLPLGLMELAAELLRAGDVRVVPGRDVHGWAESATWNSPPAPGIATMLDGAAEAFGATHVLAITVERAQDQSFRVALALHDASGTVATRSLLGAEPTALLVEASQAVVAAFRPRNPVAAETAFRTDDAFLNEAFSRGLAAYVTGDCEETKNLLRIVADQAPAAFQPRHVLANCDRILGNLDAAEVQLRQLIDQQQGLENGRNAADAQSSLGVLFDIAGRHDEARSQYAAGMINADAVGAHDIRAKLLVNQAILERYEDPEASLVLLNRAAAAYSDAGVPVPGYYFSQLGNYHYGVGRNEDAREAYLEAIDRFTITGNQRMIAIALSNVSRVDYRLGRFESSKAYLRDSIATRSEIGDVVGLGRNLNLLARMLRREGDLAGARAANDEAMTAARRADNSRGLADAWAELSFIEQAASGPALAIEAQTAAGEAYAAVGDTYRVVRSGLRVARLQLELGEADTALATSASMLEEARNWGQSQALLVEALRTRARIDRAEDRLDAATPLLEEARGIAMADDSLEQERAPITRTLVSHYVAVGAALQAESLVGWLTANDSDWRSDVARAVYLRATGAQAQAESLFEAARSTAGDAWTADYDRIFSETSAGAGGPEAQIP